MYLNRILTWKVLALSDITYSHLQDERLRGSENKERGASYGFGVGVDDQGKATTEMKLGKSLLAFRIT